MNYQGKIPHGLWSKRCSKRSGALLQGGITVPGNHNLPSGPTTTAVGPKSELESARNTGRICPEGSSFGPPGFSCFTGYTLPPRNVPSGDRCASSTSDNPFSALRLKGPYVAKLPSE